MKKKITNPFRVTVVCSCAQLFRVNITLFDDPFFTFAFQPRTCTTLSIRFAPALSLRVHTDCKYNSFTNCRANNRIICIVQKVDAKTRYASGRTKTAAFSFTERQTKQLSLSLFSRTARFRFLCSQMRFVPPK